MDLHSYLFCLSFYVYIFFLPPSEDNGLCFWVPDALCQHLEAVLWNLLSVKCSFNKFVVEKVVSLSYSSTILGPPHGHSFKQRWQHQVMSLFYYGNPHRKHQVKFTIVILAANRQ